MKAALRHAGNSKYQLKSCDRAVETKLLCSLGNSSFCLGGNICFLSNVNCLCREIFTLQLEMRKKNFSAKEKHPRLI